MAVQREADNHHIKIVIVGLGAVGASYAYALLMKGVAREIVLVDLNEKLAEGEAMDLKHGLAFVSPSVVRTGSYEDCRDAQLVVITAGAAQKPGESRLDLINKNAAIFREIIPRVSEHLNRGVILVITNPVDVLTRFSQEISSLPAERIIGSGTVLDSSRFRSLLSAHCEVDTRNVHAYVIGEYGDSEVPVWSRVNIGGVPLSEYCTGCDRSCGSASSEAIFEAVRSAAYQIIERKGSTNYAIGLAALRITESIVRDERSVLTVSVPVDGYLGIDNICLSIPTILGQSGVVKKLFTKLEPEEEKALLRSAGIIKQTFQSIN